MSTFVLHVVPRAPGALGVSRGRSRSAVFSVCSALPNRFSSGLPSLCATPTAREQHDDGEERETPLGQLVWNPLPPGAVPDGAAARVEEDDPAQSDEGSAGSEEESSDEQEVARRERGRIAHWAGGATAGDDTRRRPWEEEGEESPRRAARSLSPATGRNRTRGRAATDVVEADSDGVQSARRVSSALPERAQRREAAVGWFGRVNTGGGNLEPARAGADEIVPSAERLVASILQASGHGVGRWARTALLAAGSLCAVPNLSQMCFVGGFTSRRGQQVF